MKKKDQAHYLGVDAAEKYLRSKCVMASWQLKKLRNKSLEVLAKRK